MCQNSQLSLTTLIRSSAYKGLQLALTTISREELSSNKEQQSLDCLSLQDTNCSLGKKKSEFFTSGKKVPL